MKSAVAAVPDGATGGAKKLEDIDMYQVGLTRAVYYCWCSKHKILCWLESERKEMGGAKMGVQGHTGSVGISTRRGIRDIA
jgi:hypothetical protein